MNLTRTDIPLTGVATGESVSILAEVWPSTNGGIMRIDVRFHFDAWMNETCKPASNTWKARTTDIESLTEFLSTYQLVTLGQLTTANIASWRDFLLQSGYAVATVNRRMSTVREFINWLRLRYPHLNMPALTVPEVAQPKRPPRGLTHVQIDTLREWIAALSSFEGRSRLSFCFEFLRFTGLRPNELIALKFNQRRGDFLKQIGGKKEHFRDVFLEPEAIEALELWQSIRRVKSDSLVLTASNQSQRISYETLRYWFQRLGQESGIENFSMYSLRHTRAIELLERTGDLPLVADQLGHQFIETTMHYLRRSNEQIAERLRLREAPHRWVSLDQQRHQRFFGRDVENLAFIVGR